MIEPRSCQQDFGELRAALARTPADAEAIVTICAHATPRERDEVLAPYLRGLLLRHAEATRAWSWAPPALGDAQLTTTLSIDRRLPGEAVGQTVRRVVALGPVQVLLWSATVGEVLRRWALEAAAETLALLGLRLPVCEAALEVGLAHLHTPQPRALAIQRESLREEAERERERPAPDRLRACALHLICAALAEDDGLAARGVARHAAWLHKLAVHEQYEPLVRDRDRFEAGLPRGLARMSEAEQLAHLKRRVATLKARALHMAWPGSAATWADRDAPVWLDLDSMEPGELAHEAMLDAFHADLSRRLSAADRRWPRRADP